MGRARWGSPAGKAQGGKAQGGESVPASQAALWPLFPFEPAVSVVFGDGALRALAHGYVRSTFVLPALILPSVILPTFSSLPIVSPLASLWGLGPGIVDDEDAFFFVPLMVLSVEGCHEEGYGFGLEMGSDRLLNALVAQQVGRWEQGEILRREPEGFRDDCESVAGERCHVVGPFRGCEPGGF